MSFGKNWMSSIYTKNDSKQQYNFNWLDDNKRFAGTFFGSHPLKYKTNKPNILIMSDSILDNSWEMIKNILKNMTVTYIQHPHHCKNINKWLDIWEFNKWKKYDVIFFFDGMHGFPPRVSEKEHQLLTPRVCKKLKTITQNIIWCNCSPLPEMKQGEKNSKNGPNSKDQILTNDSVIERNKSIKKEMMETNTRMLDIYSLLKPIQSDIQIPYDCHFNKKGASIIAKAVTNEIITVLR